MRYYPNIPDLNANSSINLLLKRAKENRTVWIEEYETTGGYSALKKSFDKINSRRYSHNGRRKYS